MFAARYNFVWPTCEKGNSGKLQPTAAMLAGLTDHLTTGHGIFTILIAFCNATHGKGVL